MAEAKKVRCAIYTRKSSEEGLEQEYNSLDAQYDACAAYITSQRHEGWTLVRERYDDGGFSGGTLERPALKRLLADVAAGKVDVIVLYKIDRLTRALSDFAKIVEVLDKAGASFVSVTQSFNTTTSMGRLMLNVLLSFAQFEREVTGERIRDKVAASKKKGMWMGGPAPLGYEVCERKLVVNEAEAATVRHLFGRYAALGSGQKLLDELRAQGYRTKVRPQSDGTAKGGIPFSRGMLFHLLGNRIYRGEMVHKGAAYPGEHDAIVDEALWNEVQAKIASNSVERGSGRNAREPSLLVGLIFDGLGRRMSPSHAVKAGRRYRYYITHASAITDHAPAWRMPANDVETIVVQRLVALLADRNAVRDLLDAQSDGATLAASLATASQTIERFSSTYHRRNLIAALVQRVALGDAEIALTVDRVALLKLLGAEADGNSDPLVLTAPAARVRRGKEVKLVLADGTAPDRDDKLVTLMADAYAAQRSMVAAPHSTVKDLAATLGQCRHRLARVIKISYLAPDIVEAILEGRQPPKLTVRALLASELPIGWDAQKAMLGFA